MVVEVFAAGKGRDQMLGKGGKETVEVYEGGKMGKGRDGDIEAETLFWCNAYENVGGNGEG